MKFTVATAALLAETVVSKPFTTLHGHYPSSSNHGGGRILSSSSPSTPQDGFMVPARKLEALSVFSSANKKKDEHAMDIGGMLLKNKKQNKVGGAAASMSSSSSRGQKLHGWVAEGRQLQLVNLARQEETYQECDPYYNADPADVGILGCGQGRYCLESALVSTAEHSIESSLGGVCVEMPDESTVDILDTLMQQGPQGSRRLQANDTTIIDDMYEICYGNFSGPSIICDCQGVDKEAYSGSLSCQYQELCANLNSICDDIVTFCYTVTYELSVSAPYMGGFQIQHDFTVPNVFKYSYGVSYAGTPEPDGCTIAFDGTQCNSCAFSQITNEGSGEPAECVAFDCSNTDLGLVDTLCDDYTIVELIIADYLLYGSLPCADGCNLCGPGGYVTDTETNFTFPSGETYACGLVEQAAQAGFFAGTTPDMCVVLPPLVEVTCGCSVGETDITVAPAGPTTTAAPSPAGQQTAMPVLAPDSMPTATTPSAQAPVDAISSAGETRVGFASVAVAAMGWVAQQFLASA